MPRKNSVGPPNTGNVHFPSGGLKSPVRADLSPTVERTGSEVAHAPELSAAMAVGSGTPHAVGTWESLQKTVNELWRLAYDNASASADMSWIAGELEDLRKALQAHPDVSLERLAEPPAPGLEQLHEQGLALVCRAILVAQHVVEASRTIDVASREGLLAQAGHAAWLVGKVAGYGLIAAASLPVAAAFGVLAGFVGGVGITFKEAWSGLLKADVRKVAETLRLELQQTPRLNNHSLYEKVKSLREAVERSLRNSSPEPAVLGNLRELEATLLEACDGLATLPIEPALALALELTSDVALLAASQKEPDSGVLRACGKILWGAIKTVGLTAVALALAPFIGMAAALFGAVLTPHRLIDECEQTWVPVFRGDRWAAGRSDTQRRALKDRIDGLVNSLPRRPGSPLAKMADIERDKKRERLKTKIEAVAATRINRGSAGAGASASGSASPTADIERHAPEPQIVPQPR